MSFRYFTGRIVRVNDKGDKNYDREGPIIRQNDDDQFSEVHFEDHRAIYSDHQLDGVSNSPMLDLDQIKSLPDVPLVNDTSISSDS